MSFNQAHMINLSNYEEYFILYMDNELTAEQKLVVEAFVAQHPHLGQELNLLMSTKLPLDEISFTGKEELLSSSMKLNAVDESLLLFIDNELPDAERKAVEKKIAASEELSLQHSLLVQTKLDASEKIAHPDKKELYRYTERVVAFKTWMRVAAAIILLLLGSLFFFLNKNEEATTDVAKTSSPAKNTSPVIEQSSPAQQKIQPADNAIEIKDVAQSTEKMVQPKTNNISSSAKQKTIDVMETTPDGNDETEQALAKREVIKFDVNRFIAEPQVNEDAVVVNKNITRNSVTSFTPERKTDEDTQEPADLTGDFKSSKKTPAKGFFRRVTRFIERNTGIGTANADNEVLIGAVALKLK